MKDHQWVKIIITPISVVNDPEVSAEPVIFIREDDETEAIECAQYGCLRCDEALNSETVNTECEVLSAEDIASTFIDLSKDQDKP